MLDIYTPEPPTKLEWWEEEFLPTVAAAFSCGFTDDDKNVDINTLPSDIREDFDDNLVIQQVWRLTKGISGLVKSNENVLENNRTLMSVYTCHSFQLIKLECTLVKLLVLTVHMAAI